MGTRQGKETLGQGWAKTWDKAGTRLGTGLEARLGPWPWGSKFGLEKNFCSSVWKPILSDHAESEGSTAKNEGVGSLCVCWDIVPFLNSEKLGPGTWKAGQDLGQWTNWDQTSRFLARPVGPMLDKTGDRTLGQDLGQGLGQDLGQTMGQDLGQDKGQLGHGHGGQNLVPVGPLAQVLASFPCPRSQLLRVKKWDNVPADTKSPNSFIFCRRALRLGMVTQDGFPHTGTKVFFQTKFWPPWPWSQPGLKSCPKSCPSLVPSLGPTLSQCLFSCLVPMAWPGFLTSGPSWPKWTR